MKNISVIDTLNLSIPERIQLVEDSGRDPNLIKKRLNQTY